MEVHAVGFFVLKFRLKKVFKEKVLCLTIFDEILKEFSRHLRHLTRIQKKKVEKGLKMIGSDYILEALNIYHTTDVS